MQNNEIHDCVMNCVVVAETLFPHESPAKREHLEKMSALAAAVANIFDVVITEDDS